MTKCEWCDNRKGVRLVLTAAGFWSELCTDCRAIVRREMKGGA